MFQAHLDPGEVLL